MAKLSEEEAAQLKALQDKAKAKDAPAGGGNHRLNVSIDLADEAQVARAQKLGLLGAYPEEEAGGEDEEAAGEGEETPGRKGYFGA